MIASGVLWWQFSPRQPQLPVYAQPKEQSATYQAGGADCRPEVLALLAGKEAASEGNRCSEASEQHRLQSDDLIQQTRAADAAQSGARTAFEATRVALWGLIGGLLTLVAAAFAAYYARRAYLETKRSADLAEKSLEITARPFIYLEGLDWEELSDDDTLFGLKFTFRLGNLGHLPATNLRIYPSAELGELGKVTTPIYNANPITIGACPRGVTRKVFGYVLFKDDELELFNQNRLTIFLSVKVIFDTRFKKNKRIEDHRWADKDSLHKDLFYLQIPNTEDTPLLDRMEGDSPADDDKQHPADG